MMRDANHTKQKDMTSLVYDGGCPLCKKAASYICSTNAYINAVDARHDIEHILIKDIAAKRLNLNKGMVIFDGNTYHHGAAAVHYIILNMPHDKKRALYWMSLPLRFLICCHLIYPFFRFMRFCVLKWKGLPPLKMTKSRRP